MSLLQLREQLLCRKNLMGLLADCLRQSMRRKGLLAKQRIENHSQQA